MSNVNSVTVSGNLTADPEVVADGKITKLRLAVNRTRKVEEEYVEEASYFNVVIFGNFAALAARKLRKGNAATIQGRLEEQRWEAEDGSNRSKVQIVAFEIDSPAFFLKDEDIPASENAEPAAAAGSSQGDDIPF